jgi:histidine ammonia-lyase
LDYRKVVFMRAAVRIDPAALTLVRERRAQMLEHVRHGGPAYGINTGLGLFNRIPFVPEDEVAYQRQVLVGRACAVGAPLSEPVVRGAILLRLSGFLKGMAGVSAELCERLAELLNRRWLPVVPASCGGNAGEVAQLAHLFQTLVGEGTVLKRGEGEVLEDAGFRRSPAASAARGAGAALADLGLPPIELRAKEALALVNGAPIAPALASVLALRTRSAIEHATLTGALTVALTGASARPYSPRIARLKGDPGQALIHERMTALLSGSGELGETLQAPVSLRVIPQVHGPALDALADLEEQLRREYAAVADSPVWLESDPAAGEPAGLYSTGNFHSGALSLRLEALALALGHVHNLLEKRLHRLLDSRFTGLPDQLSAAPGVQSGVTGLHKQVLGLTAHVRTLALPASLSALDGSTGQEDFEAHTLLVALRLERLLEHLELALAYELVALRQAQALSSRQLAPPLAEPLGRVAALVPAALEDRSLAADVERVLGLVRCGELIGAQAVVPLTLS